MSPLDGAAERIAINHPIQGTEAEIIKYAMLTLHDQLKGEADCAMTLQVHDELVFEIRKSAVSTWLPVIREAMEQAVTLSVPLPVDIKIGTNWAEMTVQ